MQLPNEIARTEIALEDQFFDLKGLSLYSSLGISSLRHHIKKNGLPVYCIRNEEGQVTKILVRRSEFNVWMEKRWRSDIEAIADKAIAGLK